MSRGYFPVGVVRVAGDTTARVTLTLLWNNHSLRPSGEDMFRERIHVFSSSLTSAARFTFRDVIRLMHLGTGPEFSDRIRSSSQVCRRSFDVCSALSDVRSKNDAFLSHALALSYSSCLTVRLVSAGNGTYQHQIRLRSRLRR